MARSGRWGLAVWAPFLSLLVAVPLFVAGSFVIDLSPLRDVQGSWGYAFFSVLVAAWFTPVPLVATLVLGAAGMILRSRSEVALRRCAVLGAVVLLVCAGVVAGFGGTFLADDNPPAGVAFAIWVIWLGLMLSVPALVVLVAARRARRVTETAA